MCKILPHFSIRWCGIKPLEVYGQFSVFREKTYRQQLHLLKRAKTLRVMFNILNSISLLKVSND